MYAFYVHHLAVVGNGVLLLLLAVVGDGVPLLPYPSLREELELPGVAVLSHQCRHPGGFPSLSESNGKERLLMAPSVVEMNGAGWRSECANVGVLFSGDEWRCRDRTGLQLLFGGGL
jgi:hypothetical protein